MDKKKETSISLIHDQKNAEEIGLITAVTGEQRSRYLYWQLELSMQYAKRIDLVVSFFDGIRCAYVDSKAEAGTGKRCFHLHPYG